MLHNAWQKIYAKNGIAGSDGVDLALYRSDLRENLRSLQTALVSGMYKPHAEKRYEYKNRIIYISCVDDKIVQTALAAVVASSFTPSQNVHGFIKNRSVFTAKEQLDGIIDKGITQFSKIDIHRFYESINCNILIQKLDEAIGDKQLLALIKQFLVLHSCGVSTGSCLSPVLTNLYLADFDRRMDDNSTFYLRYVDDMIVSPVENKARICEALAELKLEINMDKSKEVDAAEGFRYLGFDIKHTIDEAIQNGNFALAEKLYSEENTVTHEDVDTNEIKAATPQQHYEIPKYINAIVEKCHIVRSIVEKATNQKYLALSDKMHLLQIFHCLDADGAAFIHNTLRYCADYDYAETERRIKKYRMKHPIGCKKLSERFGDINHCICNFAKEKMYPTPIIHAKRVKNDCFILSTPLDNIGHFKSKTPKHRAEDALSSLLNLNKKAYEICEQQRIFKGQIEHLFEHNDTREFQTPQGLLVKTDEGIFIKVV
jgi:RNA-directed DNA polymerase